MSGFLPDVQVLEQRHEAVEGGLDHRLLVERHERALLVGFHFIDNELDLFHANIVILADPQGLDHLPAQRAEHGGFRPARRLIQQKRGQQSQQHVQRPGEQEEERIIPDIEVIVPACDHDQQGHEGIPDQAIHHFGPLTDQIDHGQIF